MVVLLAGGAAHAQHPPAPSIAAYAALPAISRVSLSDDGSTLAYLRRQGGASEVIVQTVNGEVLAAIDVSDRRPVGVSWASPDHVLIRSLVFESQLTIGESLLPQLDIVNVRTKRVARALRSADRAVVNAVYDYWRGERGGRPVLYVQAMTTERNAWTPDIYRIDLDTGRGVLSSSGLRDTRGYLLGADGEVKLRIASDTETGRIRLSVPQGSGWREIYRRTDLLDGPNVWGFGPQGDTVMVSALEDGENVLLELGLADGSRRRRTDLPAAADQAIYDRTGRLLAIGAGGDSSQWVFFEPKLEAAFDLMHRGLPARQLTVVSYNSDYTKFVFYSEGAGEVGDLDTLGRDRDDLVLTDREGLAGVLDEGGDVGTEEVLALTQTDHERRVAASADDEHSDTQWLRADVDAFLASEVRRMEIPLCERTEVTQLLADGAGWRVVARPSGGLLVPVIRNASDMALNTLVSALDAAVSGARNGALGADSYVGATVTLNNTGALGSVVSQPILPAGTSAIIAFEAIVKRPVVVAGDAIAIRPMVNVCLTFDHRVLDGLEACSFLQALKQSLEGLDASYAVG